jgi:hypothetical protein
MTRIKLITLAVLLFGCSGERKGSLSEADSIALVTITRMADEGDDALTREADQEIPTTEVISGDSVRVRYLLVMNCCGRYSGSVRSERDSLFLDVVNSTEEACTCNSIFELTYAIPAGIFRRSKGLGWRPHQGG